MNEDFVPFELAVKLKEKGFKCMYPIAMYNEKGVFHELYTSVGNMQYYDYDDFDERDTIAPTVPQVLKWLRKKKIVVSILPTGYNKETGLTSYYYVVYDVTEYFWEKYEYPQSFETWEECELSAIEYVLDNLI